jgi:hypothetical protein
MSCFANGFPMRRVLFLIALACLALATSPARAAEFFEALPDVPLMPGLLEAPDDDVSFDVPEGRIVETEATGQPSVDKVLAFYARALPQLGWTQAGEATFRRDGETLTLEAAQADKTTTHLTVRLTPQQETDGALQ